MALRFDVRNDVRISPDDAPVLQVGLPFDQPWEVLQPGVYGRRVSVDINIERHCAISSDDLEYVKAFRVDDVVFNLNVFHLFLCVFASKMKKIKKSTMKKKKIAFAISLVSG
jgi:hypothetical protein